MQDLNVGQCVYIMTIVHYFVILFSGLTKWIKPNCSQVCFIYVYYGWSHKTLTPSVIIQSALPILYNNFKRIFLLANKKRRKNQHVINEKSNQTKCCQTGFYILTIVPIKTKLAIKRHPDTPGKKAVNLYSIFCLLPILKTVTDTQPHQIQTDNIFPNSKKQNFTKKAK